MKTLIKKIFICIFCLGCLYTSISDIYAVSQLSIETISKDFGHEDIIKQDGNTNSNAITIYAGNSRVGAADANPKALTDIIQTINQYLWFSLAAICMAVLIYGGFKLIGGSTDGKKLDEAIKLIVGAVVGIAICIFAYMIVRLVVNIL